MKPTRIIPSLAERMKQKQATSNNLAARAGVSPSTVFAARHGKPVMTCTADWIEEALERFEYKYLPRGRWYGAPFRGKDERRSYGRG